MTTPELIEKLLANIGEDPQRPELQKTPRRAAQFWDFVTQGYRVNVDEILRESVCEEKYDQMVLVKDIDFYSICEHHLVPFYGKAHVAYIPAGKMIGLSKIPRLVEAFSRRLQIQERLTDQIARTLQETLGPKGVAIVLDATHLCMRMRGIEKQNSQVTTSAMYGVFREKERTRMEFLDLIKLSHP